MRSPRLQDVANKLQLSCSTVSLALRNSPKISSKTKEAVRRVAAEMGYTPNPMVAALMAHLKTSEAPPHRGELAFVARYCPKSKPIEALGGTRLLAGAAGRAEQLGFSVGTFLIGGPGMQPSKVLEIFRARNVHGAILFGELEVGDDFYDGWSGNSFVMLGQRAGNPRFHYACPNHFDGLVTVFERLLRRGHRRIGLMLGSKTDAITGRRYSGAYLLCQQQVEREDRVPALVSEDWVRDAWPWFEKHRPDAIITAAIELREYLAERGASSNQVTLAHLNLSPELRTWCGLDQRHDVIGATGVDLLVSQIYANERGVPCLQKVISVDSRWVEPPKEAAG